MPGNYKVNRNRILKRQERFCNMCGCYVDPNSNSTSMDKLTIDHIIPISKGGSKGAMSNLQVVCFCCNQTKGNRIYETDSEYNSLFYIKS